MKETSIKIFGGKKLRGEVKPIPNKNSLVAALPATILTNEDVIYEELPNTLDIIKILQILKLLGATIRQDKNGRTIINCKTMNSHEIDQKLGGQFRASILFAGPLLARFGKARIPMPGGCTLGFRSISAHVDIFKQAGVNVELKGDWVEFTSSPKQPKSQYTIWPLEISVTATENLAMYAAGTLSEFIIIDAACEPHVTDLLTMLVDMGAVIDGIGSNKLVVKGAKEIRGVTFKARPDFVDITGFIVAAAITDGEIRIKGANIPDIMDGLIKWLELFGIEIIREKSDLIAKRKKSDLKIDEDSGFPLAAPHLPKLAPRPWPGFPVDVIPVIATLACKMKGRLLLQNWMYEDGFQFVRELNSLGADILILGPQRIEINGPIRFHGGEVTPPRVIQAMKAVFLAALCDPAETVIHGIDILKRRYPNIIEVYRGLGATIEVLD